MCVCVQADSAKGPQQEKKWRAEKEDDDDEEEVDYCDRWGALKCKFWILFYAYIRCVDASCELWVASFKCFWSFSYFSIQFFFFVHEEKEHAEFHMLGQLNVSTVGVRHWNLSLRWKILNNKSMLICLPFFEVYTPLLLLRVRVENDNIVNQSNFKWTFYLQFFLNWFWRFFLLINQ